MRLKKTRRVRRAGGAIAVLAALMLLVTAAAPIATFGADHLDAPALNPGNLAADINDVYVFTGADPNATVLAATFSPAAGAIGPDTFGTDIIYQFNVVDAPTATQFGFTADIAFRAVFGPPDGSGDQSFQLYRADGTAADGHTLSGSNLIHSGTTNQVTTFTTMAGEGKFFAGLRSDPFFFDFAGFLGTVEGQDNGRQFNDGNEADFFEDLNVLALVIELPDDTLPEQSVTPIFGGLAVWASTGDLDTGEQLDRMGRPAINTVVNSTGPIVNAPSANKDLFNESHPGNDSQFQQAVEDALAALSSLDSEGAFDSFWLGLYTNVLLPDKLPFNKADLGNPFAVPGVFNGRNLADDVIDIELNIVTGGNPLGISSTPPRDANGAITTDGIGPHDDYLSVFPYLGEPHGMAPPPPPPPPTGTTKIPTVGVIDQDAGLWYLVDPVLADLSGDNEVPSGSGDPNGSGQAVVTFNDLVDKICFNLTLIDLQSQVTAAHIHEGAAGVNGPVVVDLDWPRNGNDGCVSGIDQALIDAILADLDAYYVNVHTGTHPAGAVRGQLGGGPLPPFFFGNPGDDPFLGDWDGDGIDTPGLYRPSDGKVYLRNSNSPGIADIEFFFGDPGDVPIVGDWDGDGDDTVGVYRPSQGKFFIHNELGSGNRGLGKAEIEFIFGDPFDEPFFGDFDGDGKDSVGVKRGTVFYWRNSLSTGPADNSGLRFGDPFDEPLFGDWDGDGLETPGLYRPSRNTLFLRNLREPGIADMEIFADGFESGDTSAWSR